MRLDPIGHWRTLCIGSGLLLGLGALDCAFGHCDCWLSLGRENVLVLRKERLRCIATGDN